MAKSSRGMRAPAGAARAAAKSTGDPRADFMINLLCEYSYKYIKIVNVIRSYINKYKKFRGTRDREGMDQVVREVEMKKDLLSSLGPAAGTLAEYVSQQIEHAELDDLVRLELRLRLAEYEQSQRAADGIFSIFSDTARKS
jgi:hypothetical protein